MVPYLFLHNGLESMKHPWSSFMFDMMGLTAECVVKTSHLFLVPLLDMTCPTGLYYIIFPFVTISKVTHHNGVVRTIIAATI
jgi:hypothetical protein